MEFVNRLGYLGGVVPSIKADKKHLKHMIEVSLLIRAHYLEDRQVAFGKLEISFIPLLSIYLLFRCVSEK